MSDKIPNSEDLFEERCLDHGTVYCLRCRNENRATELVSLRARLSAAEKERDGLKAALEAIGDDLEVCSTSGHIDAIRACADHAQDLVSAALATKEPSHG